MPHDEEPGFVLAQSRQQGRRGGLGGGVLQQRVPEDINAVHAVLAENIGVVRGAVAEDDSGDAAADLPRDAPGLGQQPQAQLVDFPGGLVYLREHPDFSRSGHLIISAIKEIVIVGLDPTIQTTQHPAGFPPARE
ncbi:MAG: hypothetical protein ABID71_02455 [Chloroflexota bacterium]